MPALESGSHVGPYEILAPIGAGGMGEVYRSRDTKLKREVAIKVLPAEWTRDPDRIHRFQREAQVLATLNHPHIGQIYGVEDAGGTLCLVLELVEGETLAERLKRGAIPVEDALELARQIAEALEAAHERDIVHRDLKPANIKITPQGKVKVLDFGLAKAVGAEGMHPATSHSPTMMSGTVAGVILGTAAYMSPEQARGRAVDKRTDNWAFGCVLYEMLTGHQAFDGEDVTDVIAQVVRGELKWDALPANTPAKIRQLLARCLTKDPSRRLRDIGDGRIEIDEAQHGSIEPQLKTPARAWLAWAIAAGAILMAAAAWLSGLMRDSAGSASAGPPVRFSISPPKGWSFLEAPIAQEIALSPDGARVAFSVSGNAGSAIAVRALDALDAELVPGTEGGRAPFWSPDGRFLGFEAGSKVKRIELSSGAAQAIADAPFFLWATWGSDGTIIIDGPSSGLFRVPAAGGKLESITTLNLSGGEIAHTYPTFLPDGRHFFYSVWNASGSMPTRLATTVDPKQVIPVLSSDSGVQYAAGYAFFIRAGKLMAQRFDELKLNLSGEPIRLVEPVFTNPVDAPYPGFGVSKDFVAFGTGNVAETQLTWLDRNGKEIGVVGTPDRYLGVSLSPREAEAAVVRYDRQNRTFDIWILNLSTGISSRSTFDPLIEGLPVWSPDGESIVFDGNGRSISKKLTNGSAQAEAFLKLDSGAVYPSSWSMDGRYIAYTAGAIAGGDIGLLPMSGDKKPLTFLKEPFDHSDPQISPNSKWVAYASNESGRSEIYVVSFPKPEGKWQISIDGGIRPKWRRDGKELFFLSPSGQLMSVEVNGDRGTFQKSVPKVLFNVPGSRIQSWYYNYDVAQNGQRFLFNKVLESSEPPTITVISNWQALLK